MRGTCSRAGAAVAVPLLMSLALTAASLAGGPPAAASRLEADPSAALAALESEVAALVELTAFDAPELPHILRDVADEWELAGKSRSELLDWLGWSEDDGVSHLAALTAATPVSEDVRRALDRLSGADLDSLRSGGRISLPPTVYEHALVDLDERGGRGPDRAAPAGVSPTTGSRGQVPATGAPAADVPATGAPATSAPAVSVPATSSSGGSTVTPWVVAGALAIAVAGLVLAAFRRRRRDARHGTTPHLGDSVAMLFDASRRFGSSVETAEILTILVEETRRLTGADGAAVVGVVPGTLDPTSVVADPVGLVGTGRVPDGVLRRALDTGSPSRTVTDDPGISGGEHAVLAVPLVRSGAIAGVVVATRPAGRPFSAVEADALGQLVPIAAAALVGAGRHDDVAEQSLTDGLTELGNRRRLDRDLVAALSGGPGSVGFVMVDIDHFKQFNDTHGHVAGDEALQLVARLLRGNVRDGDIVYRYGGEEFCVLLPDAGAEEAAQVAERLRRSVEEHPFVGAETQPGGRLTISVGMALADRSDPDAVKLRADQALYAAKHRGRNQVVIDPS